MPMQYISLFRGSSNDVCQMIFRDIFVISAQNMNCGYSLEPPH